MRRKGEERGCPVGGSPLHMSFGGTYVGWGYLTQGRFRSKADRRWLSVLRDTVHRGSSIACESGEIWIRASAKHMLSFGFSAES